MSIKISCPKDVFTIPLIAFLVVWGIGETILTSSINKQETGTTKYIVKLFGIFDVKDLKSGDYRKLSPKEVAIIYSLKK